MEEERRAESILNIKKVMAMIRFLLAVTVCVFQQRSVCNGRYYIGIPKYLDC